MNGGLSRFWGGPHLFVRIHYIKLIAAASSWRRDCLPASGCDIMGYHDQTEK